MLIIAKKLRELSFGQLMEIYREGNLENGREAAPLETEQRQIAIGEQDFYNYLDQVFFRTPQAYYAIWEKDGAYVSALRLEPFRDGLLLEALETRPDCRRKGYAKALITGVLEKLPDVKVYSHVSKRNFASLRTHESCGFEKKLDYAVCADGSVKQHMVTMCFSGVLEETVANPEKV